MFHMPQKNVPFLKLPNCNINNEDVDHFNFLGLIIDKKYEVAHTYVQKVGLLLGGMLMVLFYINSSMFFLINTLLYCHLIKNSAFGAGIHNYIYTILTI